MTRAEYALWWEAYEMACAEGTERDIDQQAITDQENDDQ